MAIKPEDNHSPHLERAFKLSPLLLMLLLLVLLLPPPHW